MVECSDASSGASGDASLQPMLHTGQPYLPRSLTAAIIWRLTGLAPSLAPKAANQCKTAPTWIPNSAPPPPSATSTAGCLAGLVGVVGVVGVVKVTVSPGETIVT